MLLQAVLGWKTFLADFVKPFCGISECRAFLIERAAEDSVQPDHQLVVVSKRQREHQEQPAKATAVEDAVSSFVNDKGQ